MLELRPNCEWCDRDLPPDSPRRDDLYLRVHVLRDLRAHGPVRRLPHVRGKLRSPPDPAAA